MDDRNLGAKASDPSVDNDGNALLTGSQYFNTSDNTMRVYNGTAWQLTAPVGALINSNNLSDVSSAVTARSNLGLGTVATTDASAYALASQADQTVVLTAGTGLSVSGTYPNFTVTNTAPEQTVVLTGAGATTISGTHPNFTITSVNTTYSVGDGGLTQNNFTDALLTKLNGIETSADVTDTANVVNALTAGTDISIAADGTISNTAAASANTTYGISWVDSNNDAILRLTPSSGSNDDLSFIAGTNITLTPSGDNLTFATTATVNDTDANLKARANHTGTQAVSTIAGLQTALDAKVATSSIVDNVTTTTTNVPLSANQGKVLKDLVDAKAALSGATYTGDIGLGDNNKLRLGASQDLEIYHDGTHSQIRERGTGKLLIYAHDAVTFEDETGSGGNMAVLNAGGSVDLYHNGSKKLETTSSGVTVTGTLNGRNLATDGTKLDGIETNATADQTDAEIRAAVEAASNSNVFTDADHTKLNNIESNATADQTGSEIKSLYEGENNTNAFTDSEKTKLTGIETGATGDQTGAEIKIAYEGESDTNAFTDAEKSKLTGIETSATADQTDAEIEAAYNSQVAQVSSAERTAGTETGIRRYSPADVKSMVDQHSGSVSVTSTAVDNAGAVMNTDTTTASMDFVIDEDDFSSNSDTKVPTQQSVKAYIASYLDRVGTYIWSDTQPAHTLPCNGNTYNRSDYAALYAKNGPSGANTLGPGNGSTTFNTLDPRGRVPRVTDDGKGVDPDASSRSAMFTGTASGDYPGSIQSDAVANHTHRVEGHNTSNVGDAGNITTADALITGATWGFHHATSDWSWTSADSSGNTIYHRTSYNRDGAGETRMENWGTKLWVYYE